MRWVRHRDSENKRLFPYQELSTYDDCEELIICLSERSLNIILNALKEVERMRTRVWTLREGDLYFLADDSQFDDFRQWMSDVYNQLGSWVMCNEKLERIAVALETMQQQQDEQTIDLFDVLEALGIDAGESEADILEALQYILDLPGFPSLNFKIPKVDLLGQISAWRFNGAILNLLEDISISQRGQTVAQGGVDMAAIYNTLGDTPDKLLLKGGYAGWAIYIWNRVKPKDIPVWYDFLSSILGAALGSIRGAAYDLVEAIENLDLADVATAIRESTDTTIVNCNNCTAGQLYDIVNDDENQGPYAVVEDDSGWMDYDEPPVSDDTTWAEPEFPDDQKCQGSRYIVGWLIGFYGREEWEFSEDDNVLTLAEKFRQILAIVPPIGVALSALSTIIGRTLAYLSSGQLDIFVTISEVLTDLEEDLVCAIYNADNPDDAREAFKQVLIDDGRLLLTDIHFITVFLTLNNVMALPFYNPSEIGSSIEMYGTACECAGEEFTAYDCLFMATGGETESPTFLEQDAQPVGGAYIWAIGWTESDERTFSLEGGSLTPHSAWTGGLQAIDGTSANCGAGNNGSWDNTYSSFAVTVVNGPNKTVQFYSSTPFRMRVTITG